MKTQCILLFPRLVESIRNAFSINTPNLVLVCDLASSSKGTIFASRIFRGSLTCDGNGGWGFDPGLITRDTEP